MFPVTRTCAFAGDEGGEPSVETGATRRDDSAPTPADVSRNLARRLSRRTRPTGRSLSARLVRVRGSRGDGRRGGVAGARAKRASGNGCARAEETSCASPRGRARGDARARASRPPRATPEKNRGTETRVRAKRREEKRGPHGIARGLFPMSNGASPRARAELEWRTFVCLGNNGKPSSSKSSLPLIAPSGAYRDTRRGEPNEGDCVPVAYALVLFSVLLSGREQAGVGARGALRTRASATRDACWRHA